MLITIILSACEETPFDLEPKACEGLSTQANLDKVQALARQKSGQTNFKIAIFADPHSNTLSLENVIKRINDRTDLDFVVALGDLTDNGLSSQYNWICKNLADLKKPFINVIGNHDSLSNGKLIWAKYFGPFNFSFTYLGTKFIAYNDNAFQFSDAPDQNFIINEAKISPGELRNHTIAMSHVQPISEVHDTAFQASFLKMLSDSQVELTLHGHRHAYFFDKDIYGNQHYVVADTTQTRWGVLSVEGAKTSLYNCTEDQCQEVKAH